MVNLDLRDMIAETNPEAVVFDNPSFDNSIIGLTIDGSVVYALELMIDELSKEDNITADEALDFIEYNTIRTIPYIGSYAPVIIDNDITWFECCSKRENA